MQTYGFFWSLLGASPTENIPEVYAYWPLLGVVPGGNAIDVSKSHDIDEKRRIGRPNGSGPFWHHRSQTKLMSTTKLGATNVLMLVSGTYFAERKALRPACTTSVSKQGSHAYYCSFEASGIGNTKITFYEYRCAVLDRRNNLLECRSFQVTESVNYGSIPHNQATIDTFWSTYGSRLTTQRWYQLYKNLNHADILTGTSVNVDYSSLEELSPTPPDFIKDWELIQILGYPIGSSANFAQRAYEIAASDMPHADVNALANTMESAGILRQAILSDITKILPKGRSFSKAMTGAWLAYRYSVCTTKMDVESYKDYLRRLKGMSGVRFIKCRSVVVDPDTGDIYRVMMKFKVESFNKDFNDVLDRLGFQLSLVNAWDMVPYSFVIDWFTNISSLLEVLDQKSRSAKLMPVEAWASRESADRSTYIRWETHWMPTFPLVLLKDASRKTLFMRVADAISLLANR